MTAAPIFTGSSTDRKMQGRNTRHEVQKIRRNSRGRFAFRYRMPPRRFKMPRIPTAFVSAFDTVTEKP